MPNSLVKVDFSGGVNLLRDPTDIGDNQAIEIKNFVPVRPGILSTRPASKISSYLGVYLSTGFPISILPIPFTDGWPDLLFATRDVLNGINTVLYAANEGSTSADASTDFGAVTAGKVCFVPFIDKIYIFGGYPSLISGKILSKSGGGGVVFSDFTFAGAGNSNIIPTVATTYKSGRFIYGNFGPGFEDCILFSDRNQPTAVGDNALAANGRFIRIGTTPNDKIVAIKEITQTSVGSPSQLAALILTANNNAFILTGEPSESGVAFSLGDLEISKIAYPCGCASADTFVQTPYGYIWAGSDDVWFFATGQLPVRIGTNIRPALERSPVGLKYKWHAAYFNGFYRLAIFGDGQGPDDDAPCKDQFWLDLRNGAPNSPDEAKWYGPQQYYWRPPIFEGTGSPITITETAGTYCLGLLERPGQQLQLYTLFTSFRTGFDKYMYSGVFDVSGGFDSLSDARVLEPSGTAIIEWAVLAPKLTGDMVWFNGYVWVAMNNGTTGAVGPIQNGLDGNVLWKLSGPQWFLATQEDSDSEGNSIHIDSSVLTKSYDFGEATRNKIFQGAEIDIYSAESGQLLWDLYLNNGHEVSLDNSLLLQNSQFIVNDGVLNTDRFSRNFQSLRMAPDDGYRFQGNSIQLSFRNDPAYIIQEGVNDTLVMGLIAHGGDALDENARAVPIPVGRYATLPDLLTAISTSFQTVFADIIGTNLTVTFSQEVFGSCSIYLAASTGSASIGLATTDNFDTALGLMPGVAQTTAIMLGFDGGTDVGAATIVGLNFVVPASTSPAHKVRIPSLQFSNIILKVRLVPRRPQ